VLNITGSIRHVARTSGSRADVPAAKKKLMTYNSMPQDMQQCRDDLAAQEARFQQQRADDLQRKEDGQREHVETLAALQAQSQDPIQTLGDKIKRVAVQRPDSAHQH
jgi:hypothetical protein